MNRINGTRFATQEELAKSLTELNMNDDSYPVGGIPLLAMNQKVYVDATDTHSMIFGATGSKKTRMFAMPSIGVFARGGESFVVTDPKGEIYERTVGDVLQHGHHVTCINLRDFRAGETWNPLSLPYYYYHHGKKTKAVELTMEMARLVIGEDSADETFWINGSVDIFCGLVLLLFELGSESECNFKAVSLLWKSYTDNRKQFMKKVKADYGNTVVYQKLSELDNAADRTVGSFEAFISMGLNKIEINEEFRDFLCQEGLDLREIVDKKNAIYLVIPDENKSYHFVASLFLEQLYEVLIEKAQEEESNSIPIRMNFLIDEFANMPKIDNMECMITAARSRNIRFHLIVQGIKQLKLKYGEAAETIMGNCNNWVYLYSKEYNLLGEISRLCGEVIYDNNMRMPLFSEFDLQHLSKEKGEALVLSGRNFPCLTTMADISEYPYPVLPAKDLIKPKEWKPIRIGELGEPNRVLFSCSIRYYDDPYKRVGGRGFHRANQWLVAVGPDRQILAHDVFYEDLIQSKAAMGVITCKDLDEKEYEPEYIEWYTADTNMHTFYNTMMKEHPERVYVSLDDLGVENFKKKSRKANTQGRIEGVPQSVVRLRYLDSSQEPISDPEELGRVDAYAGNVGTTHLMNFAFRKANEALKGTDYEKKEWSYKESRSCIDGSRIFVFHKWDSYGNYAEMQVLDCREAVQRTPRQMDEDVE